jgi:hypothetical protein
MKVLIIAVVLALLVASVSIMADSLTACERDARANSGPPRTVLFEPGKMIPEEFLRSIPYQTIPELRRNLGVIRSAIRELDDAYGWKSHGPEYSDLRYDVSPFIRNSARQIEELQAELDDHKANLQKTRHSQIEAIEAEISARAACKKTGKP